MSAEISINMVDGVTPELNALERRLSPSRLARVVGPRVRELVRDHLAGLGPNKRGWPSTGFYEEAARATTWQPDPAGVLIRINKIGMRQRFKGGHIAPVKAKALAIPMGPVSYGHTPADFPGAFLIRTAKGAYLVQQDFDAHGREKKTRYGRRSAWMGGNAGRRQRAALNFLFKLVSGVDQAADPDVLPPWEQIGSTAVRAIEDAVQRKGDE